jgi:flagellar basal-body rod modification protein FlgD
MSSIDTVSSLSTTTTSATSGKAMKADSETFLKLLTEQLRHQDPMEPQDSSAFMAQLSQMTMVEQITALGTAQSQSNALSMLGKTVTYLDTDGSTQSGTVESVDVTGPSLQLEGAGRIKAEQVQTVA